MVHRTWGYEGLLWGEEDATSAAHLLTSPGEQLSTKSICCPGRGAVGATGGNSHLAGFKTKLKSQLHYNQSRNGYNIKFFNLKKKKRKKISKSHSPFFLPRISSGGKSDTKGSCTLRKIWLACQFIMKKSGEQKSQAPMLMMTLKGA